jgi:co-chaperonin GroES (HSP10)
LPQAFANSIKGSGSSTTKGTVLYVGPEVTTVKKNDVVYFSDFTGMEINYEESLVLVMKEDEIMAVDLG